MTEREREERKKGKERGRWMKQQHGAERTWWREGWRWMEGDGWIKIETEPEKDKVEETGWEIRGQSKKKDLEKQRLKRWRGRIVKQWATKELENRELEDNFSCRAGSKMDAAHGNTQLKAELTCCVSDSSPAAGTELWSHTASFK